MKHLFIINPAAGKTNKSVEFTKQIAAFCKPRGLDYEVKISRQKGDCTAIARKAAKSGEEYRIYACGGDGTLNEVVCGVAGYANVAVTNVPGGSGNDFNRAFSDPAAFSDLERLVNGPEMEMDLISVCGGKMYALNICSMGIDARIGTEVSRYKRIPGLSGHGAYNVSTVVNLVKGISRPCEVDIDGQTIVGDQTLICICNGQFYGGGFHPVPEARPDDGLLDVLIIKPVSLLTAAKVIGQYKRGEYSQLPQYITHYRVKELTVRTFEQSVINVDGECLRAKDAAFSVAPEKIRYFYPEGVTYGSEKEEFAAVSQ